jgi:hypothetical protein
MTDEVIVDRGGFVMRKALVGMLFGAALVVAPAAPAAAAPAAGATVDIKAGQVRLLADGTVLVPIRVRCSAVDAFEVGVGVGQGSTFGGVTVLGGAFPACTGTWQSTSFVVTAESGTYQPGPATVSAYVAAYDPAEDHDIYVEDSAQVRLRLG